MIRQAAEELVLAVFGTVADADVGGDEPPTATVVSGTGVWIFGEIALCKHPEVEEQLIVRSQMGEVAA